MEHPFPPERIEWVQWTCPALIAFLIVGAVASRGKFRVVILCLLATATTFGCLLMLPSIQGAREAATRTQCRNNLHIIGEAISTWHDEYGRLPEPVFREADKNDVSWRVRLAPYLGESALATGYNASLPWDDAVNMSIARREPTPYVCPTSPNRTDDQQRHFTAYALLTGDSTAFRNDGPLSFDQISDGLDNTLLVGEACGARIVWTEPRDVDVPAEDRPGVNLPGAEPGTSAGTFSSYHEGGAFGLLVGGQIQFLNDSIDPDVLRALLTADGGDRVSEF